MKYTLSVTQVNNYIKNIFEAEEMLIGISVFGEISNFKLSGGYAYFDIKEEGASLSCVMFNTEMLGQVKNGDKVIITGRVNYHVRLGKLSFVVSKLEPYGMGELYQKYLELKEKLTREGLFAEEYKIPIPRYAKRIGVVTSATGAVIHDIINVTRRKNPYTDIVLYPVKVQGEGAENDVACGIVELDKRADIDVIIVARGGGSFEDLAAYNTEVVARAVFACHKPIISAVGHETDFSLCDFAADMRAPTPTAGADLAVFNYVDFSSKQYIKLKNMLQSISIKYDKYIYHVKTAVGDMVNIIQNRNRDAIYRIKSICKRHCDAIDKKLLATNSLLEKKASMIELQNPMGIIKRGYSRVTKNGNTITSVNNVEIGDELINTLHDGKIITTVQKVITEEI